MKVIWTLTARKHLQSIHDYIAQSSLAYALKTVDQITRRSQQIIDFPLSGRMVPEFSHEKIREVIEGPYRIIYLVGEAQIEILALIHAAQQNLKM